MSAIAERTCGNCGGFGFVACGLDPYWPCGICNTTGTVVVCMERATGEDDEPCLRHAPCTVHKEYV